MKVAICAYDAPHYHSGPNTWLRRILPALRDRGIEGSALFITEGPGPTIEALRSDGFFCPSTPWLGYTEQRIRWLLERLAENPPDVFVANTVSAAYYAGRWVREAGIPVVGALRSDDPYYRAIAEEFVTGAPRQRLSAVVCVSKYLEQQLRARTDIPLWRIPSGAPLPAAPISPPGERLRLVYSGRLEEKQKRISEVTRALGRAVLEVPGTEAVILGDGAARPQVEQIIRHIGSSRLRLAGPVAADQMQRELAGAHAIVLLSDYEGLPVALLEAMACGLAPICLRMRSGVDELIEHGRSGLIVEDREDAFVEAVRTLREDEQLFAKLSSGARAKVAEGYSLDHVADRWAELLGELTAGQAETGPGKIVVPKRIALPPRRPDLRVDDTRQPVWPVRIVRRLLRPVRRVVRRAMGRGEP